MPNPIFTHDPDFPFLLVARGGKVIARFADRWHAVNYSQLHGNQASWQVVDTTPTPRIPVDAEVITWNNGAYLQQIAQRNPRSDQAGSLAWFHNDRWRHEESLLELIDGAKITVLDPREGRK